MVLADQPVGLPGELPLTDTGQVGRERLGVPARLPRAHVRCCTWVTRCRSRSSRRSSRRCSRSAPRCCSTCSWRGCCPDRRRCSRSSCSASRRCRRSCRSSYAESMHLFLLFARAAAARHAAVLAADPGRRGHGADPAERARVRAAPAAAPHPSHRRRAQRDPLDARVVRVDRRRRVSRRRSRASPGRSSPGR